MAVRTRFAPSPTGYLHVGGARTALFCYLFARARGGQFILRIEDTDKARSTEASVQAIFDGLDWLNLTADEGPYFQSERLQRYREVVRQLLDAGHAYPCYCTPEELDAMRETARANNEKPRYNGYWRDRDETPPDGIEPVVRFRNPLDGEVIIDDAVKGPIHVSNRELDDLVILRSDGSPTYNLTVVVDDVDMGITHVIRGDDHVNNTPRQINILEALGAARPVYAHLPMILGEDGKRLSKRHGAVSVLQFQHEGYLPEALLNHLVRLGWSYGDREHFSLDEMIELFALEDVNRSGAVFDRKKLDSINQHYLQTLPAQRVAVLLQPWLRKRGIDETDEPPLESVVALLRDRARTLIEMADGAEYFYRPPVDYDAKAAARFWTIETMSILENVNEALGRLEEWSPESIQAQLESVVEQRDIGFGKLGQPLRLAVTGGTASPAMNETLALLSQDSVSQRIDRALEACRRKANVTK